MPPNCGSQGTTNFSLKTFLVPVAAMPQRNETKEREKEQQQQATFLCDFCISFLSLFTCNRQSLTDIL